ncbi:hypothetical protein [Roseibium sp. RKSG952]|uniref:hypothetical protein n=1 Tax=Roseibium sp. RKSG952 TaxID=2529384 RepID=UPI0012BBA72E|nr:hypothetical protein [Roseibium sp. RKSG952]MTI00313.1 hypothetical protein [Roseibium sp. RKSG952]
MPKSSGGQATNPRKFRQLSKGRGLPLLPGHYTAFMVSLTTSFDEHCEGAALTPKNLDTCCVSLPAKTNVFQSDDTLFQQAGPAPAAKLAKKLRKDLHLDG